MDGKIVVVNIHVNKENHKRNKINKYINRQLVREECSNRGER